MQWRIRLSKGFGWSIGASILISPKFHWQNYKGGAGNFQLQRCRAGSSSNPGLTSTSSKLSATKVNIVRQYITEVDGARISCLSVNTEIVENLKKKSQMFEMKIFLKITRSFFKSRDWTLVSTWYIELINGGQKTVEAFPKAPMYYLYLVTNT